METSTIIQDHIYGRTDVYEIVSDFPKGYEVWPIGRQHFPHECYVPLARPIGNFHIDLTTLKAIRVKDEQTALAILREASLHGNVDEKKFNKLIK